MTIAGAIGSLDAIQGPWVTKIGTLDVPWSARCGLASLRLDRLVCYDDDDDDDDDDGLLLSPEENTIA